jgi:phage repressor protein C with HTH and peptisase S24 domain
MNTILNRIDERLAVVGKSRRKASLEAGLSPEYIRDLNRRQNMSPTIRALEKLAPVLQTSVEWLRSGDGEKVLANVVAPDRPIFGGGTDISVYRAVEGGPGEIVIYTDPIYTLPRPYPLRNVAEAFAVVVSGQSMIPVIEPGSVVLVNPYLPLTRGKNTIFIDDRNGNWTATIKKLIDWDSEEYHVYQHNPPKGQNHEFVLRREDWPKIYRVVGNMDAT